MAKMGISEGYSNFFEVKRSSLVFLATNFGKPALVGVF